MTIESVGKTIKFNFRLYQKDSKTLGVIKADESGKKRRYLAGIASGPALDSHGERMTPKCVKSMMDQAKSGTILVTADLHGKGQTEDIGKLVDSKIMDNGDWWILVRLHDEADGFDKNSSTMQTVEKLWMQVNGLGPYEGAPLQKGFSIEGRIPRLEDILEMDDQGGRRVIDDIKLLFVTVVPDPSYKASIVQSIQKALGERTIFSVRKEAAKDFYKIISAKDAGREFWDTRFDLDMALNEMIQRIMTSNDMDKKSSLVAVLNEYSTSLINLIITHPDVFESQDSLASSADVVTPVNNSDDQPEPELSADTLTPEQKDRLKNLKSLIREKKSK